MHANPNHNHLHSPELNCMTFVAGCKASASGRVLVGHNEDDRGYVTARHGWVPAADWPEGTVLPAEPGCAAIPQVKHTYGYDWSEFRDAQGGLSNADSFLNEKGVVITSNSCVDSREDISDPARLTDGGIAYNLRRVLAERASTAREGLEILIDMVETWGYAPSGRAYTVADAREAFMMQIVSGKHYLAARVPDDFVVIMPNHYTFHRLDEFEEMYRSDDLISYAIEKGWYVPAVPGCTDDFDFARVYQAPESYMQPRNVLRHQHSLRLLGKPMEGTPFAVRPDRPLTVQDFIALLSNHYEGTDDDLRVGCGCTPHGTVNRRVCCATTVESFVCEPHEQPLLSTTWMCLSRPCELPYLPVHPLAGLPEALVTLDDPAAAMAVHVLPDPAAVEYTHTLRQRFCDFASKMEMVYCDAIGEVTELRRAYHQRCTEENAALIRRAEDMLSRGEDPADLLRDADRRNVQNADRALQSVSLREAQLLTPQPVDLFPGKTVSLTFRLDGRPEALEMGLCCAHDRDHHAAALSLTENPDGSLTAEFPADPHLSHGSVGLHECVFGGRDASGKAFTSLFLTRMHQ